MMLSDTLHELRELFARHVHDGLFLDPSQVASLAEAAGILCDRVTLLEAERATSLTLAERAVEAGKLATAERARVLGHAEDIDRFRRDFERRLHACREATETALEAKGLGRYMRRPEDLRPAFDPDGRVIKLDPERRRRLVRRGAR